MRSAAPIHLIPRGLADRREPARLVALERNLGLAAPAQHPLAQLASALLWALFGSVAGAVIGAALAGITIFYLELIHH